MRADGSEKRAVTRAFPDGDSFGDFSGDPISWASGEVEGTEPWPAGTLRLPTSRTSIVDVVRGELAADGWWAASVARRHLEVWNASTLGQRRARLECDNRVFEPAMAGSTAAFVCTIEGRYDNLFHEIRVSTVLNPSRVIAHGDPTLRSLNLHGDGDLLVYNGGHVVDDKVRRAKLWRVVEGERSLILEGPKSSPVVAVDEGRIAILQPGRTVDIRGQKGRLLHRVRLGPGPIGGVELTANRLVVLRGKQLLVYNVATGERLDSLSLRPSGLSRPRLRDAYDDYAVYAAGMVIHIVRLSDGRDLSLEIDNQAGPADVQIEATGLFYTYSEAFIERPGRVSFVPFSQLRAAFAATSATAASP